MTAKLTAIRARSVQFFMVWHSLHNLTNIVHRTEGSCERRRIVAAHARAEYSYAALSNRPIKDCRSRTRRGVTSFDRNAFAHLFGVWSGSGTTYLDDDSPESAGPGGRSALKRGQRAIRLCAHSEGSASRGLNGTIWDPPPRRGSLNPQTRSSENHSGPRVRPPGQGVSKFKLGPGRRADRPTSSILLERRATRDRVQGP